MKPLSINVKSLEHEVNKERLITNNQHLDIPADLRDDFPCPVCEWAQKELDRVSVYSASESGRNDLAYWARGFNYLIDNCPLCSGEKVWFNWTAGRKWLRKRGWHLDSHCDGLGEDGETVVCLSFWKPTKEVIVEGIAKHISINAHGPDDESALLDVMGQVKKGEKMGRMGKTMPSVASMGTRGSRYRYTNESSGNSRAGFLYNRCPCCNSIITQFGAQVCTNRFCDEQVKKGEK